MQNSQILKFELGMHSLSSEFHSVNKLTNYKDKFLYNSARISELSNLLRLWWENKASLKRIGKLYLVINNDFHWLNINAKLSKID